MLLHGPSYPPESSWGLNTVIIHNYRSINNDQYFNNILIKNNTHVYLRLLTFEINLFEMKTLMKTFLEDTIFLHISKCNLFVRIGRCWGSHIQWDLRHCLQKRYNYCNAPEKHGLPVMATCFDNKSMVDFKKNIFFTDENTGVDRYSV